MNPPTPPAPVWLDGRLRPSETAAISVHDRGLLTGDGVFETLAANEDQAEAGTAFALTRHLDRLRGSAEILGVPIPDDGQVREAISQVLAVRTSPAVRLRVTWTAGPAPDGPPALLVTTAPLIAHPPQAAVVMLPWPRNERSPVVGAKSLSYADNSVARRWALSSGADEGLFLTTDGRLCEGTTSNVFLVLDSTLVTPTLGTGCLAGVTRSLVIQWCDVMERDVWPGDVRRAEELFLTSSTRPLQPVHQVTWPTEGDTTETPAGGPLTRAAMETFRTRAAADSDP